MYFTLLKFMFSFYKVGSLTSLSNDVGVMETRETKVNYFLMVIKYLLTSCPSDNYLSYEKSVIKYLFRKYSTTLPPGG